MENENNGQIAQNNNQQPSPPNIGFTPPNIVQPGQPAQNPNPQPLPEPQPLGAVPQPTQPMQPNFNTVPPQPTTPAFNSVTPQVNPVEKADIIGIISIIIALSGMQLVGLVVAIIGLKKGKKEGYKTLFSKVGLWLNGVLVVLATIVLAYFMIVAIQEANNPTATLDSGRYISSVNSYLDGEHRILGTYPTDCNGVQDIIARKQSGVGKTLTCSTQTPTETSNTFQYQAQSNKQYVIRYWSANQKKVVESTSFYTN